MIFEGVSNKQMSEELFIDLGLNEGQSIGLISEIKDVIAETTAENNEKIVEIHTLLYEDIYNRFVRLGFKKGMMAAMAQKEKLLNLYEQESTEVEINTQNNINIETHYDVSKLNPQQHERLNFLLQQAKK